MRNGVFVAASEAARALELAAAEPSPVDGAEGSLVMAADAEQVALQAIEQLGTQLGFGGLLGGGLFARPLEDLSGAFLEHGRHAREPKPTLISARPPSAGRLRCASRARRAAALTAATIRAQPDRHSGPSLVTGRVRRPRGRAWAVPSVGLCIYEVHNLPLDRWPSDRVTAT